MSVKSNYLSFLKLRKTAQENPMSYIFFQQERRYIPPFQIYGNVYYVGDSWVCVHLIDTGDGLLLIDSGNIGSCAMLIQTIWEAGFDPRNVKWIISSHGHVDHIGGARFFREMFGTKLYLGDADAKMFAEKPGFSFVQDALELEEDVFVPDVEIHEGDILTFGNVSIECHLVPGHTEGCVALFFDAHDGNETKRCGYYGGFGFNTMDKASLIEYGDPGFTRWAAYEASIDKVIGQKVDIFLGNHTDNNRTLEKRQQMLLGHPDNPFIDPEEWHRYLSEKKAQLHVFVHEQQAL